MWLQLSAVLAGCLTANLCIGIGASASAASFTGLGDLPDGIFFGEATGVSGDGSVVVGEGRGFGPGPLGPQEAFR